MLSCAVLLKVNICVSRRYECSVQFDSAWFKKSNILYPVQVKLNQNSIHFSADTSCYWWFLHNDKFYFFWPQTMGRDSRKCHQSVIYRCWHCSSPLIVETYSYWDIFVHRPPHCFWAFKAFPLTPRTTHHSHLVIRLEWELNIGLAK